jgi:AAA domain
MPLSIAKLQAQRRWVLWRLEMVRNHRGELVPTKVPYQLSGAHASSTDPATWSMFSEAQAAVGSFTGVGVVMGHGLGCVDLDHCVDPSTGKIMPWARELIIGLDSYSEFSPSGTGVHILGTDISLPGKGRKRLYETGAVELYDTARFLTFTGRWLPKTPAEILPRRSQFNALYERVADKKSGGIVVTASSKWDFDLLWAGEWEKAGFPSMSEAVFALCVLLNEKHNNDAAKVDEEFRRSGLYSGHWIDKWERLGADTIKKTRKDAEQVKRTEYTVEKFSTIQPEEIDWIFESYLARGKITGLSGEPGAAKSLISLDWAARYSTGRGWPSGAGPKGQVLVFATEDGAADTILPRFLAAGGDPENLLRIRLEGDRGFYFDDPQHLEILRRVTEQYREIGMVIIDPILEHIRANKEQDTREAYAPLRVLIAERGIALVQIVHTNKRSADTLGSVGDKVGGVKALVGLPRFVYSVHKTDAGVHHICRIKQNVGRNSSGSMDFCIHEKNKQPVINWIGTGTATAQDALVVNRKPDCAVRLLALLKDGNNDSDVVRGVLMDAEGFTLNQTRRAITQLRADGKIDVVKLPGGKSVWRKVNERGHTGVTLTDESTRTDSPS